MASLANAFDRVHSKPVTHAFTSLASEIDAAFAAAFEADVFRAIASRPAFAPLPDELPSDETPDDDADWPYVELFLHDDVGTFLVDAEHKLHALADQCPGAKLVARELARLYSQWHRLQATSIEVFDDRLEADERTCFERTFDNAYDRGFRQGQLSLPPR